MTVHALDRLAQFVAQDPLELDDKSMEVLRQAAIDTLGCIHAGAREDVAVRARSGVQAMGAEGSAAVIGTTLRSSKPQAAFLNALAGHALDFDDWEVPGNTHPSVVLFSALLAVAEGQTSGAEIAKAYVAGFEVIARMGESINFEHYDAGWHSTATLGAPGAAAACARLLGLGARETAHAMSIAISSSSGFTAQFGSHAKPVQAGFAARAGVEAALLAQAGLTGQTHIFDHPRGMAALMGGLFQDRLLTAMEQIGAPTALRSYGLVIKPWPSCGYTHRVMTCAVRARDRVAIDDIEQITLHMPTAHAAVIPFRQPSNQSEALFSAPYVVAMGLTQGKLGQPELKARTWEAQEVKQLISKTELHPFTEDGTQNGSVEAQADRMEVVLSTGQTIEESCLYPFGAPQNPMSDAQIWQKFEDNLGHFDMEWGDRLREWPTAECAKSLFEQQA